MIQNAENGSEPKVTSKFAYDAMDRRARETANSADRSTVRHFVHDQAGMLLFEEDYQRCITKSFIRLSRMTFGWREARSVSDQDQDGIVDCIEYRAGLDLSDPNDAELDLDNDGLSNLEEYLRQLAIDRADSDGDGMPDGFEVANNLQPLQNDAHQDNDGDGQSNLDEMRRSTDPNDPADFYIAKPGDIIGEQTLASPRFGSIISLDADTIVLRNDGAMVKLVNLVETSRTPLGTSMGGLVQSSQGVLVAYEDFPDQISGL